MEAKRHISEHGHVPIVASEKYAEAFTDHSLSVQIKGVQGLLLHGGGVRLVLLLDDLRDFARMWFFSDLDNAGQLNQHLIVSLALRNPLDPPDYHSALPLALQRQLLLPFGMVKGLGEVEFIGNCDLTIRESVVKEMEIPYDSVETCIAKCDQRKEEGNALMRNKNPREAINRYEAAFEALHIICVGRYRGVHGDAWFDKLLSDDIKDEWKGMHGQIIRIILRTKLVANIVKAYLELEEWEEAIYWGSRTIDLITTASGVRDGQVVLGYPARPELGRIYYRTALALKHVNRKDEAKECFQMALAYLPQSDSNIIQKELDGLGPTLYIG